MNRSLLYTPADRPDRMRKALELEGPDAPDVVIMDLEDGVAPEQKPAARDRAAEVIEEFSGRKQRPAIWVRCNSGPASSDDVEALGGSAVDGWVLPKATADSVASFVRMVSATGGARPAVGVSALVESAQGVVELGSIAATGGVTQLQLGEADLAADMSMRPSPDGHEFDAIRSQVVVASAAARLEPPIGPVATEFRDLDQLRGTTAALRRMGFGGRSTIHPAQVRVVNEVFTPSPEEVGSARAIVEAFDRAVADGRGVVVGPDGRMLDEAVVRSARRILEMSDAGLG